MKDQRQEIRLKDLGEAVLILQKLELMLLNWAGRIVPEKEILSKRAISSALDDKFYIQIKI